MNTLFSYLAGSGRKEYRFIKALGDEMRSTFPDFQQNKYYEQRVHAEERRLIAMQQKSTLYFMIYYKVLWTYRKLRKRLAAQK